MIANICRSKGINVEKIPSGGGSDANVYNKNGIKSINLGTGMELVHTTDEKLYIKDFITISEVALKIMIKIKQKRSVPLIESFNNSILRQTFFYDLNCHLFFKY